MSVLRWPHDYHSRAIVSPNTPPHRSGSTHHGVERSLYSRAVGYSFNSEKIFCNKDGEVTRVPIVEHVPPDVTAQIFWLKNRKPTEWRDVQQMEHVLGKYIISDKPMTEEEWMRERATVVDVTPTPIEDKT